MSPEHDVFLKRKDSFISGGRQRMIEMELEITEYFTRRISNDETEGGYVEEPYQENLGGLSPTGLVDHQLMFLEHKAKQRRSSISIRNSSIVSDYFNPLGQPKKVQRFRSHAKVSASLLRNEEVKYETRLRGDDDSDDDEIETLGKEVARGGFHRAVATIKRRLQNSDPRLAETSSEEYNVAINYEEVENMLETRDILKEEIALKAIDKLVAIERSLKDADKQSAILALLRHPKTRVRIKMLSFVPKLVRKGDRAVFKMVHERMFDWNLEVVKSAIASLRHSPSILIITLHQIKDLDRQSDMDGGMIRCVFKVLKDREESLYESRSMRFERRQRWTSLSFRLDVYDTEVAELQVTLKARRQGIMIGHESEFTVGTSLLRVRDVVAGNPLDWFTLRNETLAPVGSVQLKTEFEQSTGIGDEELAGEVLPDIEELLQSKDESERGVQAHDGLQRRRQRDGGAEAAQGPCRKVSCDQVRWEWTWSSSDGRRWTCCECLRKILAGGKQGCVKMALDHAVKMVQNHPGSCSSSALLPVTTLQDPDSRLVAMTVIGFAGKRMKSWMSTENGSEVVSL
eukprot:747035-Hanusia_phi.AAC.4